MNVSSADEGLIVNMRQITRGMAVAPIVDPTMLMRGPKATRIYRRWDGK